MDVVGHDHQGVQVKEFAVASQAGFENYVSRPWCEHLTVMSRKRYEVDLVVPLLVRQLSSVVVFAWHIGTLSQIARKKM